MKVFLKTHLSIFVLLMCLSVATNLNSKQLDGVWKLQSGNTINYKILKKDGCYINLRSSDCGKTYQITREGKYEILLPGLYVEHVKMAYGRSGNGDVAITYKKKKGKLMLSFKINQHTYNEEWVKADKSPIY